MNIVVHVQNGVIEHGYEMGTRQAWKCGERVHDVFRVIGVIKGQIVCVIEGVRAELSTDENNSKHNPSCEGRYIFLGGKIWHEKDSSIKNMHPIISRKINGLNQSHRYLSDAELESCLL